MITQKGMQSRQHGFTMIELIVVIVILGILAAVALPRFVNMQGDARAAKLNAARGAVQAAAGMIHGVVLVRGGNADGVACSDGVTANNTTTVCTENGTVSIVNGYPTADTVGIVNAAGLTPSTFFTATSTAAEITAGLEAEGYTISGAGNTATTTLTVSVDGAATPANCSFTYTPSSNAAGTGAAVISAAVTTGC